MLAGVETRAGHRMITVPGARFQGRMAPMQAVTTLRFGQDQFTPRKTGIIATIGPSSRSPEVLEKLFKAGVEMVRIDFAKGTHAQHGELIDRIRAVAHRINRPVKIMADLQGPRIAIGDFPDFAEVAKGDRIALSPHEKSTEPGVLPTTYPDLIRSLQPGNKVLINDGRIVLKVVEAASEKNGGNAVCEVVKGGTIHPNTIINAPDAPLKTPALMPKDKEDLAFALDKGVDVITQSYPGSADDVLEARRLIEASGRKPVLIAKIERPQTVEPETLRAIARAADGLMVARGDLAAETGINNLPHLQQRIIEAAHAEGKFAVVANKLLGSMTHSDQPTRSDVFDVAHAVESGADWLMLTGETAAGQYPVEAVQTAAELIRIHSQPKPVTPPSPRTWFEMVREQAHAWLDTLLDAFKRWWDDLVARFQPGALAR